MKDKVFWDTNLWVYLFEKNGDKKDFLKNFLVVVRKRWQIVVSVQTLGEIFSVLTGKSKPPFKPEEVEDIITWIKEECEVREILPKDVEKAISLVKRYKFNYWDCLLLAVALRSGCHYFFTEDLTHGQEIEGMIIINPFAVDVG